MVNKMVGLMIKYEDTFSMELLIVLPTRAENE